MTCSYKSYNAYNCKTYTSNNGSFSTLVRRRLVWPRGGGLHSPWRLCWPSSCKSVSIEVCKWAEHPQNCKYRFLKLYIFKSYYVFDVMIHLAELSRSMSSSMSCAQLSVRSSQPVSAAVRQQREEMQNGGVRRRCQQASRRRCDHR